jgi:autotransporter translocation and assembly factor TamB
MGVLQVDADVRASGELVKPNVTGSVRIEQGRLELDQILPKFTTSAYSTTPLEGPADAAKTAPNEAAGEAGKTNVAPTGAAASLKSEPPAANQAQPAPSAAGIFDDATVNISLVLPSNLVVRGRDLRAESGSLGIGDMNITLGGKIDVQKSAGQDAALVGQIEVVRGYYQFQGRRFDIVRGSEVRFQGSHPINPALNITADRDISGVTVEVRILATVNRPRLELSSTPPLDQSDILSMIVFNQPINELGTSQRISVGERAGTIAAGMIANPVSDAVARALDLDQFEIQPPGGDSQAGSVAVARQIGDRVFIGLKQNFGENDASTLSFEYHFTQALRLVTAVAQGTQESHGGKRVDPSGVDLIYVIRR